jgi:uncharacterized protein YndB with AHSA1/START domain
VIDGDAVIHELILPAPAEQVFDMFTDPRQLVRWIGISADLQPWPGGSGPGSAWFTPAWLGISACCTTTAGHASSGAWPP